MSVGTQDPVALLSVRGLTRYFGRSVALSDLSFRLEAGESLGLLGAADAGKTTLMRIIMGVQLPSEGKVLVRGFDSSRDPEAAKQLIAFVPASHESLPIGTVGDILHLSRQFRQQARNQQPDTDGYDLERARHEASRLCEHLGLIQSAEVMQMSPQMRRRLQYIDALQHGCPLLIVDEPFDDLGVQEETWIEELLLSHRDAGRALLCATSRRELVARVSDAVLVFRHGRLLAREGHPDFLSTEVYRFSYHGTGAVNEMSRAFYALQSAGNVVSGYFLGSGAELIRALAGKAVSHLEIREAGLEELLAIRYPEQEVSE